jgi:hypothetical protein
MAATEHPMHALAAYLPDGAFEPVVQYIQHYKVHLTITKKRKSVLGDYRHAMMGMNHRISINGDLNKYEFLVTLLHELAHLLTFEQYKNKVEAHGKEWKYLYGNLLTDFVGRNFFPAEVETALRKSIKNPAATANGETELLRVLRNYNATVRKGYVTIEAVAEGAFFKTDNGKIFKKGPKRTKRYECVEVATNHRYSFSAVSEVKLVE